MDSAPNSQASPFQCPVIPSSSQVPHISHDTAPCWTVAANSGAPSSVGKEGGAGKWLAAS